MDNASSVIIINSCEDILQALSELNGKMPPQRRSRLHLFIAFKIRDIAIEAGRSCDVDSDVLSRLRAIDF